MPIDGDLNMSSNSCYYPQETLQASVRHLSSLLSCIPQLRQHTKMYVASITQHTHTLSGQGRTRYCTYVSLSHRLCILWLLRCLYYGTPLADVISASNSSLQLFRAQPASIGGLPFRLEHVILVTHHLVNFGILLCNIVLPCCCRSVLVVAVFLPCTVFLFLFMAMQFVLPDQECSNTCSNVCGYISVGTLQQAAESFGYAPAHTTVWDYIAQKTDNPGFAKAVKGLHGPPQASRGQSTAGKPPVVLCNMCASCPEDKPKPQPGQLKYTSTLTYACTPFETFPHTCTPLLTLVYT